MSLPKGALKKIQRTNDIAKAPFVLFQSHYDDYYDMSLDSTKGVQQETILSKLFFHPRNVDLLQKQIIMSVFRRSNGQYWIEKQDEADLQVVMRSMYLQHARHVPDHLKEQIEELNNLVTDDVVPNIVSQIKTHEGYLEKVFAPRQIPDLPECVSSAGSRTLPSVIG